MEYPQKWAIISHPSEWKVKVPILIFKAALRLPTTNFFDEIMCQYGFRVDELTPNVVDKNVVFELICRTLGVLP